MNQQKLFLFLVITVLLAGCGKGETSVPTSASPEVSATAVSPLAPSPTHPPTVTATSTPAYPPETRLKKQCLKTLPELPNNFVSSGIVVLGRGIGAKQRHSETLLLDMATGQTTEIITQDQFQFNHVVSSDRKLLAYKGIIYNSEGQIINEKLIISDANGKVLRAIPWEEKWFRLLGWKDNQSLILSYDEPVFSPSGEQKTHISLLVLNLNSGERQILHTDFPNFVLTNVATIGWGGWYGVSYDPALSLVVYPSYVGNDDEMYTYSIWNISKQERVASLENIFTAYIDIFPMPRWSPDGSQFVFVGLQYVANPGVFELFRVTKDGQTEQLTHLNSVAFIQPDSHSWSPDGRYITMFLSPRNVSDTQPPYLALLDTQTMEVIDYCVPVKSRYGAFLPPIWSPDGKHLLVLGPLEEDAQRRVILVDIEKNVAVQIAENMDILGWMISP